MFRNRSHTAASSLPVLNKMACIVVGALYTALLAEIVWFSLENLHLL